VEFAGPLLDLPDQDVRHIAGNPQRGSIGHRDPAALLAGTAWMPEHGLGRPRQPHRQDVQVGGRLKLPGAARHRLLHLELGDGEVPVQPEVADLEC